MRTTQTLLKTLEVENRRLRNEVIDSKGSVRVFARVRPSLAGENTKPLCNITFVDDYTIELSKGNGSVQHRGRSKESKVNFTFDKVFTTEASQESVFEDLAELVQSAVDGYNVCVFAYGQTGSGKTYTMEGGHTVGTMGMIPRCIDQIFESFTPLELIGWSYRVNASILEIYNENIVDLLSDKRLQHKNTMPNAKSTYVTVTNRTIQPVDSAEELRALMKTALRKRTVAATENNDRSSRSHFVSKIVLEAINEERNERCRGSLNFIDLAGSEGRNSVGSIARMTETNNINKSTLTLGRVISALVQNQDHVPFRESKLTHLLMPCLGGNSKI